ncbi:MAG: hypothetical protein ABL864_06230 [Terricaulis sp.]
MMTREARDVRALRTLDAGIEGAVDAALERGRGLLRLAPCWVPRSFLHPGRRLKLDPRDLYAFGLHRGGIDERWFGSTTEAANENRTEDEGLSYVVDGDVRFTLRAAIAARGAAIIGEQLWTRYRRWPVYSKFFDNMGPIPLHMHQDEAFAQRVGREGKPEGYYFPPQMNQVGNAFPYTFFGLSPDTSKNDVRTALEMWARGDNRILDLSVAYALRPGEGWLVGPGILHAPGSLCTYEPQWGSDVFAMYQNLCEGREVSRDLLVKDVPDTHRDDLDYLIEQLDWEANVDPNFKANHNLKPIAVAETAAEGWIDRWVVYGRVRGELLFTARELTLEPGVKMTLNDPGASSAIVVQGEGSANGLAISSPSLIGFHDMTRDEFFVTEPAARAGVTLQNTSQTEALVVLRYFGPDTDLAAPDVGAARKLSAR